MNVVLESIRTFAIEAIDAVKMCLANDEKRNSQNDTTEFAEALSPQELNRRAAEIVLAEESDAAV